IRTPHAAYCHASLVVFRTWTQNATACSGPAGRRAQERERNFRTSPGIRSLSIHNWRDAMRRFRLFIVGALVLGALVPAVALAASSPTVATGSATNVTTGSAVLTGTVNPNGASTGYSFSYGTTSALGTTSPAKHAGHGTKS